MGGVVCDRRDTVGFPLRPSPVKVRSARFLMPSLLLTHRYWSHLESDPEFVDPNPPAVEEEDDDSIFATVIISYQYNAVLI